MSFSSFSNGNELTFPLQCAKFSTTHTIMLEVGQTLSFALDYGNILVQPEGVSEAAFSFIL